MKYLFLPFLFLLISLNLQAKMSLLKKEKNVAAVCLSLSVASKVEKLAYHFFSWRVCNKYEKNFKLIREPNEKIPLNLEFNIEPSKKVKQLSKFLQKQDTVDVFIFGHTNYSSYYLIDFLKQLPHLRVRLVYNSGCDDGNPNEVLAWKDNAETFIAHPETNYGGVFTPKLLNCWKRGKQIGECMKKANKKVDRKRFQKNGNNPFAILTGNEQLTIDSWLE
jgi:hypothetical protein